MNPFKVKHTQAELYRNKLAKFKAHYKSEFDIEPDDEIFYIIIRMNEMQLDFQRQIKAIPEVRFNSAWEYFVYALGSSLKWLWILLSILALSNGIVYYTDKKLGLDKHLQTTREQVEDSTDNEKNIIIKKAHIDKQKNSNKKK